MSEWKIRFGTAGTSDSCTAMGYKNSLDIPAYTEKMGLDAFEYQCGHGVRLGLDKARQMADDAAARGILFSVHAPYYISARARRSAGRWAAGGSSSTPAAAAGRAGKLPWKKRWTP